MGRFIANRHKHFRATHIIVIKQLTISLTITQIILNVILKTAGILYAAVTTAVTVCTKWI